jgi:predicted GIY-YIG superfamily endonuclease
MSQQPITDDRTDVRTALYRHFDADGKLLYVGISHSPLLRLSQHRDNARWFEKIKSVQHEWFPSRQEAMEAERKAVAEENPECNIMLRRAVLPKKESDKTVEWSKGAIVKRIVSMNPVYTLTDAGALLSVTAGVVKKLIDAGSLGSFRQGNRLYVSGWHIIDYLDSLGAIK